MGPCLQKNYEVVNIINKFNLNSITNFNCYNDRIIDPYE